MARFFTVNSFFASLGVVCFAAAAVIESISADSVLPLLTLFGAVAVGAFYAFKAPENARKKSQFDDAEAHIEWLSKTLQKTRDRLSRANARLAKNGILDDDEEDDDEAGNRGENPGRTGEKENDKNIPR